MTGVRTGRGISEAVLKCVALVTMTIDHVTAYLLKAVLISNGISDYYNNDLYFIGRVIGRIAFVLYAFMIAEGAVHTKNRLKYAVRLLILAVISIVPYSFNHKGVAFDTSSLNIFFLLFLGLITIYAFDLIKKRFGGSKAIMVILYILVIALSCFISEITNMEYGMMGICLISAFYLFREDVPKMIISVVLVMSVGYMLHVVVSGGGISWIRRYQSNLVSTLLRSDRIQIFGLLAMPFILLYNGEKGRQLPKWFYYLFYPVHLAVIGLIVQLFIK